MAPNPLKPWNGCLAQATLQQMPCRGSARDMCFRTALLNFDNTSWTVISPISSHILDICPDLFIFDVFGFSDTFVSTDTLRFGVSEFGHFPIIFFVRSVTLTCSPDRIQSATFLTRFFFNKPEANLELEPAHNNYVCSNFLITLISGLMTTTSPFWIPLKIASNHLNLLLKSYFSWKHRSWMIFCRMGSALSVVFRPFLKVLCFGCCG